MNFAYTITLLLINIFYICAIRMLFKNYFDVSINSTAEKISYIIYYFVMVTMQFGIKTPTIRMILNIICFLCITLNYNSLMKRRFIAIVQIYLILMTIETLVVVISGYYNSNIFENIPLYISPLGKAIISILTYCTALFLHNFKHLKDNRVIPWTYGGIITISICTLVLLLIVLYSCNEWYFAYICTNIVLVINLLVVYIFNHINKTYYRNLLQDVVRDQSEFLKNQTQILVKSEKAVRSIKHDISNHLFVIMRLIDIGKGAEAQRYIAEVYDEIEYDGEYIKTGNVIFDSIINNRARIIKDLGMEFNANIQVPYDLEISIFDINIILCNLLDNAIEATQSVENGYIDLDIKYCKGVLLIKIKNNHHNLIKKAAGVILSSKEESDTKEHGYGVQNIRYVVDKNEGVMDIEYTDNIFNVSIAMCIEAVENYDMEVS